MERASCSDQQPEGEPEGKPALTRLPQNPSAQSPDELREENRKLRRLELMMTVVMSVIAQDATLSIDEAAQLIADSRAAALAMFPDKQETYDMLFRPRLQRLMRERYRIM